MTTIYEIYNKTKNTLKSELEAREICAFALNINRNMLFLKNDEKITKEQENLIENLVEKRLDNTPLAYILGEWEFYSLTFKVDQNVLIPRQDTETLVDSALEFLSEQSKDDFKKVLDLCAGSGCIGIAIAKNFKNCNVFACEISPFAINIAKENAKTNEILDYTIYQDNVLEPKIEYPLVDLIVSNPPYIKKEEILTLDKCVKDFEPHLALDGGQDGLIFYEKICENYYKYLNFGGKIIFEYGINQENDIEKILRKNKFYDIKITKDLCGINRIIEARKHKLD